MTRDPEDVVGEQLAYYRARAPEYEAWWDEWGPEQWRSAWGEEVALLEGGVDRFGPTGRVLELACGTGVWTRRLCRYAETITAVDGSPETLELNRQRLPPGCGPVTFVEANLFGWQPPSGQTWDVVFFSFWLSHVPPARFEDFWALVDRALAPGGRFYLIDNQFDPSHTEVGGEPAEATVNRRRLRDGQEYDIVKVFYEPERLAERLRTMGWSVQAAGTGKCFVHAWGGRAADD